MEQEHHAQARQARMENLLAEALQDNDLLGQRRKQEMHQVHDLVAQKDALGCALAMAIAVAFVLAILSIPQMLAGGLSQGESLTILAGVGASALLWLLLRSLQT
jgi:hypothetical protein